MHVALFPDLAGVHSPLSNPRSMASKRSGSNDTNRTAIGATIEQVSTSLSIYEDTKLIFINDIKLKWKDVNDAFVGPFGEDLEDR